MNIQLMDGQNMYDYIVWIILWIVSGFASFAYWWTKYSDLTIMYALMGLLIGTISGPFSFIIGWTVHGDTDKFVKNFNLENKVLIKQRGQKS